MYDLLIDDYNNKAHGGLETNHFFLRLEIVLVLGSILAYHNGESALYIWCFLTYWALCWWGTQNGCVVHRS